MAQPVISDEKWHAEEGPRHPPLLLGLMAIAAVTRRVASASRRRLTSCPAYPRCTFDELGDGVTQDGRQICALVTARRLVPSGAVGGFRSEQAIQLGIDI
jgi:hypothetical protein